MTSQWPPADWRSDPSFQVEEKKIAEVRALLDSANGGNNPSVSDVLAALDAMITVTTSRLFFFAEQREAAKNMGDPDGVVEDLDARITIVNIAIANMKKSCADLRARAGEKQ